ncbi:uncharacterized protein LOC101847628 [Aplysia californica]|uniref:Uncharacterized protein LOC101847628 n=1 Tax=Aplysia californica TaxID=6500 RepID=A0ABM0JCN2_APLCA|nr:uncharacterized protein LOC101847628 [Aplysia californica]
MSAQFQYYPNPDDDFILQGGTPYYYRETPGFVRNSMLTDTTKNLSQHAYNAERYGDDPQLRGSLRTVSRSLNRVHGDLTKSLLEDDSNSRPLTSTHSYSHSTLNEVLRDAMNRNPPPASLLSRTEWYTKPIHLSASVNVPMSTEDMLASRYFPVTLGELKSLEMLEDIRPGRSRSPTRSKKSKGHQRSKSATRGEARRIDYDVYYLTSEAPNIKTAGIAFTSPYSDELSKLRMEKLRIEERQYLELKRQAELEKIRGPKPKWYSLKGPEFHIEAKKNNDLVRNSDKWDDLLTYRERLLNATNRLRTALQDYEIPAY